MCLINTSKTYHDSFFLRLLLLLPPVRLPARENDSKNNACHVSFAN